MPTLDNLAARFAQCVSLFRDPSAKTEQKKEFRALLGLLQDTAVTLRLASGGSGIELNGVPCEAAGLATLDRKSTRLNSSHLVISYAVFCLKTQTETV